MEAWEASILGLVQGITEILPISSTAHILLLADLFQIPEPSVAATVFLNFGSFLAIIAFFRGRWGKMLLGLSRMTTYYMGKTGWYAEEDFRQAQYVMILIIATIPALIAGFFFEDIIAETLRSPLVIAMALLGGGALLMVADFFTRNRTLNQIDGKQAFFIGCFQALALIPGFSRSGSAITGGRFLRMDRSEAATFAFLMGAPVLIAAMVYKLPELVTSGALMNGNLWLAFLVSMLSTYAAIRFIMDFVRQRSYAWFVLYRTVLAIVVLISVFHI